MNNSDEQHNHNGSEFDWERTLRRSDKLAAKYFTLLERFSELPDGDAMIAEQLNRSPDSALSDCDFDCENCSHRWNCDFAEVSAWMEQEDLPAEDDDDDVFGNTDAEDSLSSENSIFYESNDTFQALRYCAFGWSNIYAAVLPPEKRREGLNIVFYLGRALAYLSFAVGEGVYEERGAGIALLKRALWLINKVIGDMNELKSQYTQLGDIIKAMEDQLLKVRNDIFNLLLQFREKDNRAI